MGFWIIFLPAALVIGAILIPNIWKTWKSIHPNSDTGTPLGMEETDIESFNAAAEENRAKEESLMIYPHINKTVIRGPLRMGKTSDTYSKNYHKLFGKKSK